ncbi:MAG: hypothetical protein WBY94_14550 [Polyangiaceae bacterium]
MLQMEDQVGAGLVVFGQVGPCEPPLELPPEPAPLDADICMPELLPPLELELPPKPLPPEPLELEPPNALTPELLEPPPELELPFPKPSPEPLDCSPPLLELEPLLDDPRPPSSARSCGPPSPSDPT